MVGLLTEEKKKGLRVTLACIQVQGLPLLEAKLPAPEGLRTAALVRRITRAAELLSRSGCRRVLTVADFPHWPLLAAQGLCPVDSGPLCRELAAPLALAELERRGSVPGQSTVVLRGSRVSRALFQTAEALCPRVRRLVIAAPAGGEALSSHLREEYGVPVLEDGAERGDLSVCFGPEGDGDLCLFGPSPRLGGLRLAVEGIVPPEQAEELTFLALLWEEGRISTQSVQIFSTSAQGKTLDR